MVKLELVKTKGLVDNSMTLTDENAFKVYEQLHAIYGEQQDWSCETFATD